MILLLLFISLSHSSLLAKDYTYPCKGLRKGKLKISPLKEAANIEKYCTCEVSSLKFKNVLIENIPECFFSRITKLKISHVPISVLSPELLKFHLIEKLSLEHTHLSQLPKEIAQLSFLKELDLKGTSITSLPDGLGHLEKIDLRFIEISKAQQKVIRKQYPELKIYFSSPCNCD